MNTKDIIIWNNIEKFLKIKEWDLTELSRQSGASPQTINNIKTGKRGIGNSLLSRFAKALRISENELLLVEEKNNIIPINKENEIDQLNMELAQAIIFLTNIYYSQDQILIKAIFANLQAFNKAIENKKQIEDQANQIKKQAELIQRMEKRIQDLENKVKGQYNLENQTEQMDGRKYA